MEAQEDDDDDDTRDDVVALGSQTQGRRDTVVRRLVRGGFWGRDPPTDVRGKCDVGEECGRHRQVHCHSDIMT